MAFLDVPAVFLLDDDRDVLGGSHVVVGKDLEGSGVCAEVAFEFPG
jgi:hypothetical protein